MAFFLKRQGDRHVSVFPRKGGCFIFLKNLSGWSSFAQEPETDLVLEKDIVISWEKLIDLAQKTGAAKLSPAPPGSGGLWWSIDVSAAAAFDQRLAAEEERLIFEYKSFAGKDGEKKRI